MFRQQNGGRYLEVSCQKELKNTAWYRGPKVSGVLPVGAPGKGLAGVRLLRFVSMFIKVAQIFFRYFKDVSLFRCGTISCQGGRTVTHYFIEEYPIFSFFFLCSIATIPFLAETISVIYYAKNGCDKNEKS